MSNTIAPPESDKPHTLVAVNKDYYALRAQFEDSIPTGFSDDDDDGEEIPPYGPEKLQYDSYVRTGAFAIGLEQASVDFADETSGFSIKQGTPLLGIHLLGSIKPEDRNIGHVRESLVQVANATVEQGLAADMYVASDTSARLGNVATQFGFELAEIPMDPAVVAPDSVARPVIAFTTVGELQDLFINGQV
ncbi:MAG TPA: hypothetical protein VLA92_02320 [Candidatus Saccharimonadales bacterium]|nr:hypothetical protein [Candidatus Saccharimonadales bacterium]